MSLTVIHGGGVSRVARFSLASYFASSMTRQMELEGMPRADKHRLWKYGNNRNLPKTFMNVQVLTVMGSVYSQTVRLPWPNRHLTRLIAMTWRDFLVPVKRAA